MMQHKVFCFSVLALTALAVGGCNSNKISSTPEISGYATAARDDSIALTQFGPAAPAQNQRIPMAFHLGAGDALGQAIFTNYAAIVRANANWQVAGAEDIN